MTERILGANPELASRAGVSEEEAARRIVRTLQARVAAARAGGGHGAPARPREGSA